LKAIAIELTPRIGAITINKVININKDYSYK